jgi:hypothetical protein
MSRRRPDEDEKSMTATAQAGQPLGIFEGHGDVGAPRLAGTANFDPATGLYTLTAAGVNMWDVRDEFQFVWTRVTGDFSIEADVTFIGTSAEKHRKAGCIARVDLTDHAPYADAALHAGDGLTSLQFRRVAGAITEQVVAPMTFANRIRFERTGSGFRFVAARSGHAPVTTQVDDLDLGATLYVGLFLCSHHADTIERATFGNVRIVQ